MDQRTPWWKYERTTQKHALRVFGWANLIFAFGAGLQYFTDSPREYAGTFAISYLCISAFLFWRSTRAKG